MGIKVGDIAYYTKSILESDVSNFANITGDFNPKSINRYYMQVMGQEKAVVQNVFLQSLISASLGAKMPGFGTIYLGQETEFHKEVYVGDTVIVKSEIVDLQVKKSFTITKIKIECFNQNSELLATGMATAIPPKEEN